MSRIEVGRDHAGQPIELCYQDLGSGKPVVLIHGWPLSHAMWDYQMLALGERGFRVIAYDRRGFGASSKPAQGYDYDTLADDLKALLDGLNLQDVTLVGFSMGGGEVARYMARHGGARVSKVALVSAVTPYLLQTDDNPEGVKGAVFDEMIAGLKEDRPAFLSAFGKKFFGVSVLKHPVSEPSLEWNQSLALPASLKATLDCVTAFSATDFRNDLKRISVPTLIIHGADDTTVPLDASGARTAKLLPQATFLVYDDAPHGLHLTHKARLNKDLIEFVERA